MISVPEAWQSPSMPGRPACLMTASVRSVGKLGLADQRFGEVSREGRDGLGKIAPLEWDRHRRDLPMAGRRVLAVRNLLGGAEETGDSVDADRRIGIAGEYRGMAKSERHHVRHVQRATPQAITIAVSGRAGGGDMAERIRALVAEIGRIGCTADAEGVQNEDERARHLASLGQYCRSSSRDIRFKVADGKFVTLA